MADPDVFVNEDTGETMSLASYIADQRRIERDITRLDVAIETHKEGLKAAKDGRERAFRDLRSTIREIKFLRGEGKKARRRRGDVSTSRPEVKKAVSRKEPSA